MQFYKMCNTVVLSAVVILFSFYMHRIYCLMEIQPEKEKYVRAIDVEAVEGGPVSLPCPIRAPESDKVYMVLWFRDDAGIPLYSFDVRGKSLAQARHWSAPDTFGPRAHFDTDAKPATLKLEDIKRHDQGVYRCRVDFRTSQTQSFRYNLTIIIPPEQPTILNRYGTPLNGTIIGPMEEGDDVMLSCRVIGGRPQPIVRWRVNGKIVDDQYEQNAGDVIENRLLWPSVQRNDLNALFTCEASNTELVEPKKSTFLMDLHLKPNTVEIISPPASLTADRRYEVSCESVGSRPNAIITWYKGKRQLKRTKDEIIMGNTTRSEMSFVPSTEDFGKSITCRAENPNVTGLYLETTWKLNVVYPPIVTLRLGSTLSPDDIKDGDDVYFECHVQANPQWRKLYWLHEDIILSHNTSARVIRSNQSLVLQKVTRQSSGNYSCSAINEEGETVSNQLELRVKYSPLCVTDKLVILGAFRGENLNIYCEVQADPPPRSFRWKFNNSGETLDVGKERTHMNGSISILQYTPMTDQDYGTLSCWGKNEVGEQQLPCVFQLVLAGLPTAVKNCTFTNQTQLSIEIQCTPGYDGGIPQMFVLEVVGIKSGKVRFNMSNTEEPLFTIESWDSLLLPDPSLEDRSYKVVIFSMNQKGPGPNYTLKEFRVGDQEISETSVEPYQLSPILTGVMLTLFILVGFTVIRIYLKNRTKFNDTIDNSKQSSSLLCSQDVGKKNVKMSPRWQYNDNKHSKEICGKNSLAEVMEDERDPDVIPAQYVSNEVGLTYTTQWTNDAYYDKAAYDKHENRPKNLLLKSVTSNVPQCIQQDFIMGKYFPSDTKDLPITGLDLDINVNAIKNMLMATRVPESCV